MEKLSFRMADLQPRTTERESFNAGKRPDGIPRRYERATLEEFMAESHAQQEALKECQAFVETWNMHGGLLMLGSVGTGKTMLSCAMLNEISRRGDYILRYYTLLQAMRLIKSSWGDGAELNESQALSKLVRPEVLVLDEVGIQFGTETERLLTTEVINERYNKMRPTILISNLTLKEFTTALGERVIDRFREGGHVLVFDWASYRGRNT
jgi:DNA replication protein DnaC